MTYPLSARQLRKQLEKDAQIFDPEKRKSQTPCDDSVHRTLYPILGEATYLTDTATICIDDTNCRQAYEIGGFHPTSATLQVESHKLVRTDWKTSSYRWGPTPSRN